MRWRNLGEQPLVETPWFRLNLAQVELPGGLRLDHYLLRLPPLVLTAVLDDQDRVLLLRRHRFIPDSWGWNCRRASPVRARISRPIPLADAPALIGRVQVPAATTATALLMLHLNRSIA